MKQLFQKVSVLAAVLTLFTFSAMPLATVSAQTKTDVCAGVAAAGGNCNEAGSGSTVNRIVAVVVNILSTLVGIVAVIMVILGGFKYVTSNGDTSNVQSAKNTILFAIVGLVVVALAQVIVRFVLSEAT